ncbi:MAG: hypothetical protein ACIAQF_09190, partial [Phycisphaerales bacterium JB065]
EVVYRRGSKSVTVIASVGHTELDSITDDGSTTSYQSRDFKFTRSDLDGLMDNGREFEPEPGDRIIEPMPIGPDAVYEPMPMPGGQRWRWSDPNRTIIRVHTKRIQ